MEGIRKIGIKNDVRPIQSVLTMGGAIPAGWWAVGRMNVTKIEPYFENGQMAVVPWLAIYEGDVITVRINGAAVEHISYDARTPCSKR